VQYRNVSFRKFNFVMQLGPKLPQIGSSPSGLLCLHILKPEMLFVLCLVRE
jgi:hypothetical protein